MIHYKPKNSEHIDSPQPLADSNDLRVWPDACIKQVSVQIAKQVPKFEEEIQVQQKQSFLEKSPLAATADISTADSNALVKCKKTNSSQIVISAHPMQKKLADDLRFNLQKENYEVWVSTDFLDLMSPSANSNAIVSIDYPETPDSMVESSMVSLSTISEITEHNSSRVTSSATANDVKKSVNQILANELPQQQNSLSPAANTIVGPVDSAASPAVPAKRPTSLPISKSDNPFNLEKRQIKRLPSQVSEISISNNTLTPEKMQRLTQFQDKVANSKLVIILISDSFFRSRTSKVGYRRCAKAQKLIFVVVLRSSWIILFSSSFFFDSNLRIRIMSTTLSIARK